MSNKQNNLRHPKQLVFKQCSRCTRPPTARHIIVGRHVECSACTRKRIKRARRKEMNVGECVFNQMKKGLVHRDYFSN